VVVTATLLGSATLTLVVGTRAHRIAGRDLLLRLSWLVVATGLAFAVTSDVWILAAIGFIGTINPSGGDVSVFLPTEQALLPATVPDHRRTALFARYSVTATFAAAIGSAAAGLPEWIGHLVGVDRSTALRWVFVAYAATGLALRHRYLRLTRPPRIHDMTERRALGESRHTVYRLAALFSIDAFGSGFAVTAIIVLWLQHRFDLSLAVSGAIFAWAGVLSAGSQLAAVPLARRIGLVRTMVYTHIPANVLLMAAALMPTAPLAVACLLGRSALSQMDVPARTSYVMAIVAPEERAAAASVTNVPRSLASALSPLAAGWLLDRSDVGWPLLIAGALKIVYDLALLARFRSVRPPEERTER
jgi:predicted MFS family arabinose efflux permease